MRTTEPRRALAALGLVPVAAGAFAASVAWATAGEPAEATTEVPTTPGAATADADADADAAALAAQVDALRARLAVLQAQAEARATAPVAPADAGVVTAPRTAPPARQEPRVVPRLDATTRASG